MLSEYAITIRDVSKCYHIYKKPRDRLKQFLLGRFKKFYREFWAVKDISFNVKHSETVGIIGLNGAGKSTLLQTIAGTLEPSEGKISFSGRVAALLELGSGFNSEFTGRENVYLYASIMGLRRDEINTRFNDIVEFSGCRNFIDQPIKTYSSGMVVRLAFSVSINVEPDILIIDEALSVGDASFQFKCNERIKKLTESGTTLLFVSHSIGLVKTFCDRAIYLEQGKVKAIGDAEEITELYLMDMRNIQQQINHEYRYTQKTSINKNKSLAFGNQLGRICSVKFDEGGGKATYIYGDKISFIVMVEYSEMIVNPSVTVLLQDKKLLLISGKYCYLEPGKGNKPVSIEFEFDSYLSEGDYFITVLLEQRNSNRANIPIEKQVSALQFNVIHKDKKDFLGVVDFGINATVGHL